jgi:hypothetical protein
MTIGLDLENVAATLPEIPSETTGRGEHRASAISRPSFPRPVDHPVTDLRR